MQSQLLLFSILLFLVGCNPGSEVKVNTAGIIKPLLFSVNGQDADGKLIDLGEHILTDDPRELVVKIHNSTKYPYTDLDLVLTANEENAPSITFAPNGAGEIAFPGFKGTCGRILNPNTTCEVHLLFAPREGRVYLETATLNFKNYIQAEQHIGQLTLIAGMPASLTFTNDRTQYTFGDLIGTANLPVVERDELTIYNEELEIINAGGLPAKSLVVSMVESCISSSSNSCPTGMAGAYVMTNHCPAKLMPAEKCKINIRFQPKNQDPASGIVPDDIKEINYRSTINLTYIKDTTGATGGLNGYFRSISTNIEARFKVAMANLVFEAPIVSGNRDSRSFRINNLGYREGEIKGIAVRDIGGSIIATCKAHATSEYLECFDSSNNVVPLAQLPFTFKDRNGCVAYGSEAATYIDVGNGCIFDLTFQPSVTYLTDKPLDFQNLQPEVIFDSRWKGLPKIMASKLFNLSASSLAAARLVPDKFRYEGVEYPILGSEPGVVDMGRLALQSSAFFKRKPIVISFKNVGSTQANGLSVKDGSGKNIPIGGAAVSLGTTPPYYYTSVVASDSTCTVVGPGETCSVTMMFAPIGMNTNAEETNNMFDGIGLDAKGYKSFNISYDNGSRFTDLNIADNADYVTTPAEARLQAMLIRKGMLMQITEDARNVGGIGGNVNVAGDKSITHIYLQNIGTGPVPYIRYMNPPSLNPNSIAAVVSTPDPASLGADYDCLDISDEDFTNTVPANADPSTRVGNFASLPKEKSCVYTLEFAKTIPYRYTNAATCTVSQPTATNLEEGARLFSRDLSGVDMWEFCPSNGSGMNILMSYQYYDGDTSDPALPVGAAYGKRLSLSDYDYRISESPPAKLIPSPATPVLTSTLYRPEIIYPTIAPSKTTITVLEKWFYGLPNAFHHTVNDPLQLSPFIKGDESRNFVPGLSAFADRANYDYILYLGSFPQGSPVIDFPLSLTNQGSFFARLTSFVPNPDPTFTALSLPAGYPQTIPQGAVVNPLMFRFNPSSPGEHRMELEYSYENGRHLQPLIYNSSIVASNVATATKEVIHQKVLVVAHVQAASSYPFITMSAQDYDVIENPGSPPTETLGGSYPVSLSWNNNATTTTLVYDTIKLTATPTANDLYAKKVLTFTNATAFPLVDFKPLYKTDVVAATAKAPPATLATLGAGTTCSNGMTLAPGASCRLVVRYQPLSGDTSETFILALVYRFGVGQYVMQNVGISLLPRSPGQVIANALATETINYKVSAGSSTITRFSYPLNFGTTTLDIVPKTFSFDLVSGGFKKIDFVNTQATKTSFLLAYQKYLAVHSLRGYTPASTVPTWVVPSAPEYRSYDGLDYAIVHKVKYADNSERLRVEMSRGCFFGDDELNGAIPTHQKGFNATTSNPCRALIYFSANFEYLKKAILPTSGDDMRGTASELWYYSVNRSSTASVWVHIKGTINPDTSVAVGTYANVQTSDLKTASFSTPKMNPNNSSIGTVVGLRVLMSNTSTGLNDPYNTALQYVDIRPYDPGAVQLANFTTNLTNGQYFWFRTVAIRKDMRFVDTVPKRFVGLNAGEYLSSTSAVTVLKTLVPPLNHHYFHAQQMLVEKSLHGGVTYDPYLTASNRCALRTKVSLKNPSVVSYSYQLINSATWTQLLLTPAATSYAGMTQVSHWLADAPVNITTKCTGLPGFMPNTSSQLLDSSGVFYVRNSANPNSNVNIAFGGVPGTASSNYISYIDGTVGYASSRCMVILP